VDIVCAAVAGDDVPDAPLADDIDLAQATRETSRGRTASV
jgi:hypothetical protein